VGTCIELLDTLTFLLPLPSIWYSKSKKAFNQELMHPTKA
jgi:hypothetical protein